MYSILCVLQPSFAFRQNQWKHTTKQTYHQQELALHHAMLRWRQVIKTYPRT